MPADVVRRARSAVAVGVLLLTAACTSSTPPDRPAPPQVRASTGEFTGGTPAADPDADYVLTGTGPHVEEINPSFSAQLGDYVVTGTFPTTDNQVESTTDRMRVSVVNVETGELRWLQIPTSRNKKSVKADDGSPGGADVSDLCATTYDGEQVLYGISALPYKGWDVDEYGEFPMLFRLRADGNEVVYRGEDISTYAGLRGAAANPALADEYLPMKTGEPVASAGLVECASLPNGSLAVAQYYPREGSRSGQVVVFDSAGSLVAGVALPDYTAVDGGVVDEMLPRDIVAAPEPIGSQAYISVVSDAFAPDGTALPFPVTEIAYDTTDAALTVQAGPFVASAGHRSNRSAYSTSGDLYVPVTVADPNDEQSVWTSAGVAVYPRSLLDAQQPSSSVEALAPQRFFGGTGNLSVDVQVLEDAGLVVDVDYRGGVTAYRMSDGQACAALTPDLPAELAASGAQLQAIVKGTYDAERDYLWLPMNVTAEDGASVPQIYGVNTARLAATCGT
ncbi:hypothetical protein EK0264_19140 [Epidermidibacterium keratini]|uniref:Uncharacterized protein n=1 Tax=Epidermidibacterium keratini TaxID=1891644 RepID=A0A7L4YT66_9ACTN|nr:hypothetical protein [Epidermidibacterium keratini]QHC02173.1 hypothetical protein EK0264_19140 [Epidermidibacterium keratini]